MVKIRLTHSSIQELFSIIKPVQKPKLLFKNKLKNNLCICKFAIKYNQETYSIITGMLDESEELLIKNMYNWDKYILSKNFQLKIRNKTIVLKK